MFALNREEVNSFFRVRAVYFYRPILNGKPALNKLPENEFFDIFLQIPDEIALKVDVPHVIRTPKFGQSLIEIRECEIKIITQIAELEIKFSDR